MTGLYEIDGIEITTHSMISSFNRCPKMAQYEYHERLKRRALRMADKPLHRGTWVHELLEEMYAGRDWKAKHRENTRKFNALLDQEREALGDLPDEIYRLMQSYLWHYGATTDDMLHGWTVHGTEMTLECPWPDGIGLYRCKIDILYSDEWGLWIGDHKTHAKLPDFSHRVRDMPSALYLWCARENGYNVEGFVWNYLRTTPPTIPAVVYPGTRRQRLSQAKILTDYPTLLRAIRDNGLKPELYRKHLDHLKNMRWRPDAPQLSPFFRRHVLHKDDAMLSRVVASAMRTRDRMHTYNFADKDSVERVPSFMCGFCRYNDLCETELYGGNVELLRRRQFRTGDPMDYYHEKKSANQGGHLE